MIACMSQVVCNNMSSGKHKRYHYTGKQYCYKRSVCIQDNGTDTRDQYEYKKTEPIRGSVRIQENDTVLENRINSGFKLFTTIKERVIVELINRQAGMQVNVDSSEAKQAEGKLTHSTRRRHIRLGYRSQHG